MFLTELGALERETGEAVHYADLAARVGVSKWTAYDMVRLLEAEGLVVREYHATGGRGRSRACFRVATAAAAEQSALLAAVERVVRPVVDVVHEQGVAAGIEEAGRKLAAIASPLLWCATCAVLLLLLVRHAARDAAQLEVVHRVLESSAAANVDLVLVIGILTGILLQWRATSPEPGFALPEAFSTYLQRSSELRDADHRALVRVSREALAWVSGQASSWTALER